MGKDIIAEAFSQKFPHRMPSLSLFASLRLVLDSSRPVFQSCSTIQTRAVHIQTIRTCFAHRIRPEVGSQEIQAQVARDPASHVFTRHDYRMPENVILCSFVSSIIRHRVEH